MHGCPFRLLFWGPWKINVASYANAAMKSMAKIISRMRQLFEIIISDNISRYYVELNTNCKPKVVVAARSHSMGHFPSSGNFLRVILFFEVFLSWFLKTLSWETIFYAAVRRKCKWPRPSNARKKKQMLLKSTITFLLCYLNYFPFYARFWLINSWGNTDPFR